eukprot:CAMPEP_0195149456 /NCGR_PEP_ID=MMETSP0448-20130528/177085_1 /TAXON_ID=66468 /ORGANISM="Heterocapsa triquestra, Strain CCMP 448" /LENGTH=41 /DNA_ID= /DNA_START= /DNA_END= /DNA_ORIENTATION=
MCVAMPALSAPEMASTYAAPFLPSRGHSMSFPSGVTTACST